MSTQSETRTFAVHAAHEERGRRFHVESPTPEAAAMAFLECWHGETDELAVIVADAETGAEHCYHIEWGGEVRA
jgi:hypothetical protein